MSSVILAEKPDQARHYAAAFAKHKREKGFIEVEDSRFFKRKAYITWGVGHLVELQEPQEYKEEWGKWSLDTLPILPEVFKFKVDPSKRQQFNIVKKLLQQANEIILATDCDREGEKHCTFYCHSCWGCI
ncbi:toprim domain-containing protein [Metabacillus fastidiosus]|uniref:toprim domain-containing protein n=1 Tax=Metabacillus fastidiosus TaxID=1458 RepID=UPI003D2AFAEC